MGTSQTGSGLKGIEDICTLPLTLHSQSKGHDDVATKYAFKLFFFFRIWCSYFIFINAIAVMDYILCHYFEVEVLVFFFFGTVSKSRNS